MADNTAPQASVSIRQPKCKSPCQEATAKVKVKSKSKSGKGPSKSAEKQASRAHRALEKQFSRAQQLAVGEADKPPLPSLGAPALDPQFISPPWTWSPEREPEQVSISTFGQACPPLFGDGLGPQSPPTEPTATFTPTAAELRHSQDPSFVD